MFDWLFPKKENKRIEEETKKGFDFVKKDITALSGWIKHLDSEKNVQKKDLDEIKDDLSLIKEEISGLKNVISLMSELKPRPVFKTNKQLFGKQTDVYAVQTRVQTAVQTPDLNHFSVTERAILWILLNADIRLGYDDLSAILGKEKSTIRGQINAIKSKSEGLIEESIEKNGKKRVFIPDEIKEKMLKKQKVRVLGSKESQKKEKNEEKYP